jgi:hypothetical protein
MKKIYIVLIVVICLGLIGVGIGLYEINRGTLSAAQRDTDATVSEAALIKEFKADPAAAGIKYKDKVISIEGKVSSIEKNGQSGASVILQQDDIAINSSFSKSETESLSTIKEGDAIKLKGLFQGYNDDITGPQIQFNMCSLVK